MARAVSSRPRRGHTKRRTRTGRPAIAKRWRDRLRAIPGFDAIATAGDCHFDESAAETALAFFPECLQFIEGERAGTPFALEPWQQAIVANLFGWKRPDGTRRFREAFIEVARKNGKTPFLAGLVIYTALCDGEPGAQLYSAAAERDQAALIFRHAAEMIAREPELAKRCRVFRSLKSIEFGGGSFYRALSADAETKHGYNSHFIAVDELHAQPDRDLVDVLRTSTGSRRNPLTVYITTAGFDRHSICYEIYNYACKVRDGVIRDPSFLPVIYEVPADAPFDDEALWPLANPNLDVSVSRDYLRRECARAKETPTYENTFRRLHLDQWTEQDVRWIRMERWDGSAGLAEGQDPLAWRARMLEQLRGEPCFAGLDLSSTTDLTACVLWWPARHIVLPWFWMPAETAHRRERQDRVPFVTWMHQGLIEPIEAPTIDQEVLRARINQLGRDYRIQSIGVDPWNGSQMMKWLADDGFEVIEFRQGFASMTGPTKELERLVIEGKVHHGGNPVLRWMASNVTAETDAAGNLKPSKAKSTGRIDGIVGAIMAIGLAMVQPEEPKSIYETESIFAL